MAGLCLVLLTALAFLIVLRLRRFETRMQEMATASMSVQTMLDPRLQELEALRAVSHEMTREGETSTLLVQMIRRAVELVAATAGAIYLWDDTAQRLIPQVWEGYGEWLRDLRIELGEGLVGTVAQQREGMLVNHYVASPHAHAGMLQHVEPTAAIAEPLLYGDRLVGVMVLHNSTSGRLFTSRDSDLLALFANQASVALVTAQLSREALTQTARIEALWRTGARITRMLETEDIFQSIAKEAAELLQAEGATIRLLIDDVLVVRSNYGTSAPFAAVRPVRLGESLSGRVAQEGRPLMSTDLSRDPRLIPEYREIASKHGIVSYLGVPMRYQERIIGVLLVGSTQPRRFSEQDVNLLCAFADHAAIALEHSQLFEAMREREDELRQANTALVREIAEHREAQAALQESEARHRELVEGSIQGIYIQQDGLIRFVNQAALQIFGYEQAQELLHRPYHLLLAPHETSRLAEYSAACLSGEPIAPLYDFEGRSKDGTGIWLEGLITPVTWDGRPAIMTTLLDATARKQAEEALLQRVRQLEAVRTVSTEITHELELSALLNLLIHRAVELVDAAVTGAVFLWDEHDQIMVSGAWYGRGEWMHDVRLRLGEGVVGTVAQRREGLIIEDYPHSPYAIEVFTHNLGPRSIMAEPLMYHGQLVGVISLDSPTPGRTFSPSDRDILTLFALQAAVVIQNAQLYSHVRNTRDFLRSIAEHSPDAIVTTDMQGRFTFVSPGAEAMFGYSAQELLGQPVTPYYRDGKSEASLIMKRLHESGQWRNYETSILTRDGRWIEVNASYSLLHDTTRRVTGVLSIVRDITEQKRLERELLAISEREQRRLGQDLHDSLGQQLTGLGFLCTSLLLRLRERQAPEVDDMEQMSGLINHAIEQTRELSHGLYPVALETHGLLLALQHLAARMRQTFGISCQVSGELPEELVAPQVAIHLYRIVQEALQNAVRHGHATQVRIRLLADTQALDLSVTDDGDGIPEDAMQKDGLGLRSMHYRAHLLGATLSLHRQADGGTQVRCMLPLHGTHVTHRQEA